MKRLALTAAIAASMVPAGVALAQPNGGPVRRDSAAHSSRKHRHHRRHSARATVANAGGFSLRVNPGNVSIDQGTTTTVKVTTTAANGPAQSLSLRVNGLPAKVGASFKPATIRSGGSSTLTLTSSASSPEGAVALTVTGTDRTATQSARVSLDVTASGGGTGTSTRPTTTTTTTTATPPPPPTTTTTTTTTPQPPTTTTTTTTTTPPPPATTTTTTTTAPPPPPTTTTTTTTPPPAQIPTHIETWGYDDGCNGGTGASASLVQLWLTYAESSCGPNATKATTDCHADGTTYCTAIQYLDANRIYPTGSVPVAADAQENWWLHEPGFTDAAHRLSAPSSYGNTSFLNDANPAVDSWFQNYVQTNYNSYDGLMMDDIGEGGGEQFWGSGLSASQELPATSSLESAHEQMADAMTHTDGSSFLQIDNGLSVNPYTPTPFPLLNNSSGVHGLVAEGDPESDGTVTSFYSTLLDDMAYVDSQPNEFLALLSYDDSGEVDARRVQAASVLLGYSPGHIVSWSDLEQNSNNLAVWPEEGIYPTDPVQTMATPGGSGCLAGNGQVCTSGGHNDLQVAPGVYRREFKTCYNQGVAFGSCGVIMNDNSSPVTVQSQWLSLSYRHQITMVGGDVQSGGKVDPTGASFTPGSTTIPADDAILLAS
jgi:hypothetical protein